MKKQKPELVAPSGDWNSLSSAVEAGADAVYFGVKKLNMRHGASNFDILEIKKVMDFLRSKGKKGYLALNVIVYEHELDKVRKILTEAKSAGVDAVVLWDMAVLSIAKEMGLRVHLSTQASVSNFEALKHYVSLGVKRIVLARECTLSDIKNITERVREEKIDCKIETFVHGAMCVSVSGRCFLSQHTFGKSANRGQCIQPCRREYAITDTEGECQYLLGEDYIMSAKDLCSIDFIDQLIDAGIDAFKIEGRMRPAEYTGIVTASYRRAIDAYFRGELDASLKQELFDALSRVFNRGFTKGFFFGSPDDTGGISKRGYEKIYLGEVLKYYKKINVAEILINNEGLSCGQDILITGKKTPASFTNVTEMQVEHASVDHIEKGNAVGIKVPFEVRRKDKVFLWKPLP